MNGCVFTAACVGLQAELFLPANLSTFDMPDLFSSLPDFTD